MNTTTTLVNESVSHCPGGPVLTTTKVLVNLLAVCVMYALITVATIILNSVIVVAYWKSTQLREKIANFMIMVLSLNDLLVGLISCPIMVEILARAYYSLENAKCWEKTSKVREYLVVSIPGCSFYTLAVMSFERYFAIVHPMFHRTKVTRRRLMKCLILIWFLFLAGHLPSLWFPNQLGIIGVYVVSASLVFIYVKIYLVGRKSSKMDFPASENNGHVLGQVTSNLEQRRNLISNLRLAKSCLIVLAVFWVCYIPWGLGNSGISFPNDIEIIFHLWSGTLIYLNSSLNSLVFFWKNKSLRKEAFAIVRNGLP